jgi:hypothetical protein
MVRDRISTALDRSFVSNDLSSASTKVGEAAMERSVEAHNAGYDAYLRCYGQTNGADKASPAQVETPHCPYVDDPALYSAWVEGWEDAGGRFRQPSEMALSIDTLFPPPAIPAFGAAAPFGVTRPYAASKA